MKRCSLLRGPRGRGFTLIELLVVVAIIALLISILLPSLQRAREQGRTVVCASNQRSLMQALFMYADGNRGMFPTAGLMHGSGNDVERSWVVQLAAEYGRNEKIVRCPSDTSPFWNDPLPAPDGRYRRTSYANNAYTVYPIGNRTAHDRWERIRRPASTIYWIELVTRPARASDPNILGYVAADHVHPESWWVGSPPRSKAAEQVALEAHRPQANCAMLDGHVARLPFERTYALHPQSGFPPEFLVNKYDPEIAQ